jgi:hypothetical protein
LAFNFLKFNNGDLLLKVDFEVVICRLLIIVKIGYADYHRIRIVMMLLKYGLNSVAWLRQLYLNKYNLSMLKSMLLLTYLILPIAPMIKQNSRLRLLGSIERTAAKSASFILPQSALRLTYRRINLTKYNAKRDGRDNHNCHGKPSRKHRPTSGNRQYDMTTT